ncbi:hypothetical protein WMF38_49690 [Sorangium sp. So ce118]
MNAIHEKDLDVNLLRAFLVVSEAGSVAAAASRLYLAPTRRARRCGGSRRRWGRRPPSARGAVSR